MSLFRIATCIKTLHITNCTWEKTLMIDFSVHIELNSPLVAGLVIMVCCLPWVISSYAAARELCLFSFWRILVNKQKLWFFLFSSKKSRPSCSLAEETLSTHLSKLLMNHTGQICIISTLLIVLVVVCGSHTKSAYYSSIDLHKFVDASNLASFGIIQVFNASKDFIWLSAVFLHPCVCILCQTLDSVSNGCLNYYYLLILFRELKRSVWADQINSFIGSLKHMCFALSRGLIKGSTKIHITW